LLRKVQEYYGVDVERWAECTSQHNATIIMFLSPTTIRNSRTQPVTRYAKFQSIVAKIIEMMENDQIQMFSHRIVVKLIFGITGS
jgi:hypothetical protein